MFLSIIASCLNVYKQEQKEKRKQSCFALTYLNGIKIRRKDARFVSIIGKHANGFFNDNHIHENTTTK